MYKKKNKKIKNENRNLFFNNQIHNIIKVKIIIDRNIPLNYIYFLVTRK